MKLYSIFIVWLGVLSHVVPGRWVKGQLIEDYLGKRRIDYKMNGFTISVITYISFFVGSCYLKLFPATIIYDNFGALATWVIIFSAIVSLYLLVSGLASGRVRLHLLATNAFLKVHLMSLVSQQLTL